MPTLKKKKKPTPLYLLKMISHWVLTQLWVHYYPWRHTCENNRSINVFSTFKILQARLQQYLNRELPDVQAAFRKGRRTRGQIANIRWIIENAREFQKNIYFWFIDNAKAFDCVDHNKLWKILKEMGIPDHLTCLLRNLYEGQEAAVWTWNNRLVQNRKRSASRLCIVTVLI